MVFTPKLIAVAVAISAAATFVFAWTARGKIAESETRKAVESAVDQKVTQIVERLDREAEARAEFQEKVSKSLQDLSAQTRRIQTARMQAQTTLLRDIAAHQQFYSQPIPEAGRQQWLLFRELADAPSQSASSPPR